MRPAKTFWPSLGSIFTAQGREAHRRGRGLFSKTAFVSTAAGGSLDKLSNHT